MSRSYRTDKESKIAERRMPRDKEGRIIYPRIVVRRPRPGDLHPMTRAQLRSALERIPLKYIYGLRGIEMRPRERSTIGDPFARYHPRDKVIHLFSLPLVWNMGPMEPESFKLLKEQLELFQAEVVEEERIVTVTWPGSGWLSFWFFIQVFTHELGHHYLAQYRHKRKRIRDAALQEFHADMQAVKVFRETFGRRPRDQETQ